MPPTSTDTLQSVIAAVAGRLLRDFPAPPGALNQALAQLQAEQAAAVAARLRLPTALDLALLALTGPPGPEDEPWLDDTVLGWAAALLADPDLARRATLAAGLSPAAYRRLTQPGPHEQAAAALLRHPDLLDTTALAHRDDLLAAVERGLQDIPAA
ncbi:hypothetical protein [Streptacidiphilus melanogenes]|uniref:hypothetical protein n=1 Tax=Streptacidiphilus melanogenes TaxID=411235 RepID=UPI0005A6E590|nr:hypothetical protein [Streptacidiphilus melanogenes]